MLEDLEDAYEYAQAATIEGGKAHEFATLMLETLQMLEPVEYFYEESPVRLMDETVDSVQEILTKEYWPMSATVVYFMTSKVSAHAAAAPVGADRQAFQLLATRARDLAMELSTGFLFDEADEDEEPPVRNPW
jgi:hypothetical protein